MKTPFSFTTAIPLAVGFSVLTMSIVAITIVGTPGDATLRPATMEKAGPVKMNVRDQLRIDRAKKANERKARADRQSIVRQTPRYLRNSTGANVLRFDSSSSRSSTAWKKAGCGDRIVMQSEGCDDGNTANNDGCSSACAVEAGFECNHSQPSLCADRCGDGVVSTRESCDDGNLITDDGCNDICKVEPGFTCSGTLSVCRAQ